MLAEISLNDLFEEARRRIDRCRCSVMLLPQRGRNIAHVID